MANKSSREYAKSLRKMADWLDARPEFPIGGYHKPLLLAEYYDKPDFLAVVKAVGPGKKNYTDGSFPKFEYTPVDGEFLVRVSIARDKVCTKVQEAKWECEPMLSPEDVEAI